MKKINFFTVSSLIFLFVSFSFTKSLYAQQSLSNSFGKKIQFGGGLGLNFGSGFTDVSVAPSAIYNINPIVALGASLQFGYIKVKNSYETYTYGGSLIGLLNPIPQIQLSQQKYLQRSVHAVCKGLFLEIILILHHIYGKIWRCSNDLWRHNGNK